MRVGICLLACCLLSNILSGQLAIIPQPAEIKFRQDHSPFTVKHNTKIVLGPMGENLEKMGDYLNTYFRKTYGITFEIVRFGNHPDNNYINISLAPPTSKYENAYSINVAENALSVTSEIDEGLFYGLQTLIQLFPTTLTSKNFLFTIPNLHITDYPRFAYRGMHLDVSRHFFPVEFVKKYIDYLALHKFNYFHWHLTEDQGWRIEIKKYPRLTEVGAFRNGTIIGRYPGMGNDNILYGGFYTQQEIKDVVKYAADRFITVIPEIELPGHSSAAIAAYPWLSCFPKQPTHIPPNMISKQSTLRLAQGDKKLVQETWGVFDDVYCAGKDSTFIFLQDVMDEVLTLFPSKYIHVGGDESPKAHWKKCPHCQARIKKEGLKDEHELQSYFIQRMEKYLNAKGRTLIGWDEILEGGLAPNAVVMSWRGEEGGIAAAKQDHYVIMTPGKPVYFDHTQSQNEDSVTIGGYNPIEAVYAYEPVPKELPSEKAKYILGAQANVWTEYMKNTSKVEYMIFPRMSALSEVLWSPKVAREWSSFEKRLPVLFERYRLWNANFSTAYYDIKTSILPAPGNEGISISFETRDKNGSLLYGITGKHFAKNYTAPVVVTQSSELTGFYYSGEKLMDSVLVKLSFNKATGKEIRLKEQASKNYPGDGAFTLVNGVQNDKGLARSKEILGFSGTDCEAVIEFGTLTEFSNVVVHAVSSGGSWVYPPQSIEVFISNDGREYVSIGKTTEFKIVNNMNGVMKLDFKPVSSHFVKLLIKNLGEIPEGKAGAGNKAWLFVDEIEVN